MSNSEKILKSISSLVENGILTSKDIKKEIATDLKFKKDKIINKLELVSRKEFEVLKKIVQKQDVIIKKLLKNKKLQRQGILTCNPLYLLLPSIIVPPWELIISSTIANPNPTPD